jgi:hypothetical protein
VTGGPKVAAREGKGRSWTRLADARGRSVSQRREGEARAAGPSGPGRGGEKGKGVLGRLGVSWAAGLAGVLPLFLFLFFFSKTISKRLFE